MRQSEPWGAVAMPMEAHSKRRGLSPRMHESGELKYGQKEQRVPPFHWSVGSATSGALDGIAKISDVGRSKAQKAPPDQGSDAEYDSVLER